jgi:uncharacterized protein YecT (DUF1311 family)
MKKFVSLFVMAVSATLVFASAAAALSDAEYKKLMKESPAFAKADKELTQAWNEAKKALGKGDFDKLKKEQQAWIASGRDKRAKALIAEGMSSAEAYAAATGERAEAIRGSLKGGSKPAPAADARHAAYMKAAQTFVEKHELPNGWKIDNEDITEDFAGNHLAIFDVNADGKPELVIMFETTHRAAATGYIYGFDEKTKKLTELLDGYPVFEFFDNGSVKIGDRHAPTLSDEFWLAAYDRKKCKYEVGFVRVWDKEEWPEDLEGKPFPGEIDKTGDGFVYYIDDENFKGGKGMETPVDTPVYKKWFARYLGNAKPFEPDWVTADAKGLKALEKKK